MNSDWYIGLDSNISASIWLIFPSFLKAGKPTVSTDNAEPTRPNEFSLENIEENQQFESALVKRVARVIEDLPSLEPFSE